MAFRFPWQKRETPLEDCLILVGNDPIATKEFQDWIDANLHDTEGVAEMANLMCMDGYELVSGLVVPKDVQNLRLGDRTFSLYKFKQVTTNDSVYDITSKLPQAPRIRPRVILSANEAKISEYGKRSVGSIERGVIETARFINDNRVFISSGIKDHDDYVRECLTLSIPMIHYDYVQSQKTA